MQTLLDKAYLEMQAQNGEGPAVLRFYERLVDAALFMILESEPEHDIVKPLVLDTSEGSLVLAFDREDRLAGFVENPTPYIGISGRELIDMLAKNHLGLGLNFGEAPSSTQVSVETVHWLVDILAKTTDQLVSQPKSFTSPKSTDAEFMSALAYKLASMAGVIEKALLVSVDYENGDSGLMLALTGVPEEAKPALIGAISETVKFSDDNNLKIDVSFIEPATEIFNKITAVALQFDLPEPQEKPVISDRKPAAPGMDPDNPPILR